MTNIILQEKRYRTAGKVYLTVTKMDINWDEVRNMGLIHLELDTTFKAEWDGEEWDAYYLGGNEDFSATTINGVKQKMTKFFKMDPIISRIGPIIVTYK